MSLKDRMPMLLEIRREHLVIIKENAIDPKKDHNGSSSVSVQLTLRFIGVAEFIVSGNTFHFRSYLSDAAKVRLHLFVRRTNGEPIDDSFVSMLAYQSVFDALAAGDFGTATQLATQMGGRPEIEAKHDHPFDYCLGYALRAAVLRSSDEMATWFPRFEERCQAADNTDFAGYAMLFNAIRDNSTTDAQTAVKEIAKGHAKQTKCRGVFVGKEDETLSVWGVGATNLARNYGLCIDGIAPFIPQELLV